MKKRTTKEGVKLVKLGLVGLLLVIVVVVSGEQLQGIEALILGIMPYILYQLYCFSQWLRKQVKK